MISKKFVAGDVCLTMDGVRGNDSATAQTTYEHVSEGAKEICRKKSTNDKSAKG
jgi:hypothetical protein